MTPTALHPPRAHTHTGTHTNCCSSACTYFLSFICHTVGEPATMTHTHTLCANIRPLNADSSARTHTHAHTDGQCVCVCLYLIKLPFPEEIGHLVQQHTHTHTLVLQHRLYSLFKIKAPCVLCCPVTGCGSQLRRTSAAN